MSLGCLASLHDAFRPLVIEGLARSEQRGITVEFDDGGCFRTMEEQDILYRRYLAGGPRAAPAGQSPHNYGLAVDIHVLQSGKPAWSGAAFESAKAAFSEAGVLFLPPQYDDPGHGEHPQWRTLARLGNNPVTNPAPPGTPPIPPPVSPGVSPCR